MVLHESIIFQEPNWGLRSGVLVVRAVIRRSRRPRLYPSSFQKFFFQGDRGFFNIPRSCSLVLSIDGAISIYFIYISGSARSCNFRMSGYFQPPYIQASFHLKTFHHCIAGTAGIEPRPPAQQASALSSFVFKATVHLPRR